MVGKQNQYSWSFRAWLKNSEYMVCKYSFSLSTTKNKHCDLQGTGHGLCSEGLQEKDIKYIWCTQKKQLWGWRDRDGNITGWSSWITLKHHYLRLHKEWIKKHRAKGCVAVSSEHKQRNQMCYTTGARELPAERWQQWDLKTSPNSQVLKMEYGENFPRF